MFGGRQPLLLAGLVFMSSCSSMPESTGVAGENSTRFEDLYVTASDGVRLYVRVLGSGPDTVIVPAALYFAKDFLPLVGGRTLIFYDPRARGASDPVPDSTHLGIPFDVSDMESIRAHFGVSRTSLIGWSYLGAVVVLYAAEHPSRVERIVQIGPMAPRPPSSIAGESRGTPVSAEDVAYLAELEAQGVPQSDPINYCRAWMLRRMIRPMMGRPEAAARSSMDPCLFWNEWPDQLFRTMRHVIPQASGAAWDYSAAAKTVTAPVLTVHGTNDPNAPIEGGRDWQTVLPNVRLLELSGVGHAPWLEEPDLFFAEVDAFLRGAGS